MQEYIRIFQNTVMFAAAGLLLAIVAATVSGFVFSGAKMALDKLFSVFGKSSFRTLFALCMVVGAIMYGGSKSANITDRTEADEGIELFDVSLFESNLVEVVEGETNYIFQSRTMTIKVSEDSAVPTPVWFRENWFQAWTNVNTLATFATETPVLDSEQSGDGTNVYVWVSYDWTNSYSHSSWYIGTNLPPIHVEIGENDYVVMDEVLMTSSKIRIKFHLRSDLELPEGSVIEVQRKVDNMRYETIEEIPAVKSGVYERNGFEVGRTTTWRLYLSITKDE